MKKKFLCLMVIFCLMFSSNIAFAGDLSSKEDSDVELLYEQVMNMSAKLNISSLGQATCTGTVSVRPGYNVSPVSYTHLS